VSDNRRSAVRSIGTLLADLVSRPAAHVVPAELGKTQRLWQRPPGAGSEARFVTDCTRCGDCITACPHAAIGVLPEGAGEATGTPAMNTQNRPCHLCEDMPCIAACEPAALVMVAPQEALLGLAEIDEARCFPFMGPECGACVGSCPLKAIRLERTRPIIDANLCAGCGLCVEACPVWDGAINILTI
jgi:ferredoxin-type protein NapF